MRSLEFLQHFSCLTSLVEGLPWFWHRGRHVTCAVFCLYRVTSGCLTCHQWRWGWDTAEWCAWSSRPAHSPPLCQLPRAANSPPSLPQPISNSRTYRKSASSQNLKTELMSHKSVLLQHDGNQSKTEKLPRNSWTHFIGTIPGWKSKANGCQEFRELCTVWKKKKHHHKRCLYPKRSKPDMKAGRGKESFLLIDINQ